MSVYPYGLSAGVGALEARRKGYYSSAMSAGDQTPSVQLQVKEVERAKRAYSSQLVSCNELLGRGLKTNWEYSSTNSLIQRIR